MPEAQRGTLLTGAKPGNGKKAAYTMRVKKIPTPGITLANVYAARRNVRSFSKAIYINEDLNKSTTELFRQARQLVKSK